ncbi:MAG: hypothetical protein J7498_01995 [Sphingobium sp.]|nr:hypothetical protein [Sphingobium sp.]
MRREALFSAVIGGLLGLAALAAPALAQTTAPAAGAPDVATLSADAQNTALREDLVSAQAEIVRLRALVANQQDLEVALKAARERNERLVGIANELIAAYEKRYQRGQFLPFDNGRRKFEADLQSMGDRVYDNKWDAGARRTPPPATPAPDGAAAQGGRQPNGQ